MQSFHSELFGLNLSERQTNKVYELVDHLIKKSAEFCVSSINENTSASSTHVVNQATEVILNLLSARKTTHKRNKQIESTDFYVAPREIAIGLRWERTQVQRKGRIRNIPRLIQCIFQYVPIEEDTLKSLFQLKEFLNAYFQFNSVATHDCNEGNYYDFCCGDSFRENNFF